MIRIIKGVIQKLSGTRKNNPCKFKKIVDKIRQGLIMNKGLIMNSCEVYFNASICALYSLIANHIPQLQAFILFCISFIYMYYKIKVAKYEAEIKEKEAHNGK